MPRAQKFELPPGPGRPGRAGPGTGPRPPSAHGLGESCTAVRRGTHGAEVEPAGPGRPGRRRRAGALALAHVNALVASHSLSQTLSSLRTRSRKRSRRFANALANALVASYSLSQTLSSLRIRSRKRSRRFANALADALVASYSLSRKRSRRFVLEFARDSEWKIQAARMVGTGTGRLGFKLFQVPAHFISVLDYHRLTAWGN